MINEKLKSYVTCENCWKSDNCTYYKDVKGAIEKFKNTPLNIHFPKCNEQESYYYKLINEINPIVLSEKDREEAIKYFNNNKDKVTSLIIKSVMKYSEKENKLND